MPIFFKQPQKMQLMANTKFECAKNSSFISYSTIVQSNTVRCRNWQKIYNSKSRISKTVVSSNNYINVLVSLMSTNFCWPLHTCCTGGAWTFQVNNRCFIEEQTHSNESSVVQVVPTTSCSKQSCPTCVKYARTHILGWFVHASISKVNYLNI